MLVEHLEIPLAFVYLYAGLVSTVDSPVLVVHSRLPLSEKVSHHPHIIVLLDCGLVDLVVKLRGFYQSGGVPVGHACYSVEGSEFEVGV